MERGQGRILKPKSELLNEIVAITVTDAEKQHFVSRARANHRSVSAYLRSCLASELKEARDVRECYTFEE